jgi:hypothetical protein
MISSLASENWKTSDVSQSRGVYLWLRVSVDSVAPAACGCRFSNFCRYFIREKDMTAALVLSAFDVEWNGFRVYHWNKRIYIITSCYIRWLLWYVCARIIILIAFMLQVNKLYSMRYDLFLLVAMDVNWPQKMPSNTRIILHNLCWYIHRLKMCRRSFYDVATRCGSFKPQVSFQHWNKG